MLNKRRSLTAASLILAAANLGGAGSAETAFQVVPERSHVVVEVGKSGALSFAAGHTHRIVGPVRGLLRFDEMRPQDAAVTLEIPTAALRVSGEGEPPDDVPVVQETMASEKVLDVQRYPTITFESRTIEVRERRGSQLDLSITGDLTLRGRSNLVKVPVQAELQGNTLTARGTLDVRQSDYGIARVRAAGGLVSVKDELSIRFTIVAANGV